MLIKQWIEVQAARHTLDDNEETTPIIPKVFTHVTLHTVSHILVVPQSMAVLLQSLDKEGSTTEPLGTIKVEYPDSDSSAPEEDQYDEDEQLYSGINNQSHFTNASLPIYNIGPSIVAIEVPHFRNEITGKLVAHEISSLATSSDARVFILAPCQGLLTGSVFKLNLPSSEFATLENLEPPNYISGSPAALVSSLSGRLDKCAVLALNAEGHRGFEKIDADSLMDAARHVFSAIALPEADHILKQLSNNVRKLNSANTSGMYL